MKKRLLMLMSAIILSMTSAGQVGINADGSQPHSSAGLDVQFTDKAVVLPRMTEQEMINMVSPANASVVYCTTRGKYCVYLAPVHAWKELKYGISVPLPSVLDIGTGGMCLNAAVNGGFLATGFPLGTNNTADFSLMVTVPGSYTVTTDTVNGYHYSATGAFTSTGSQTISLQGSGTPVTAGSNFFRVTSTNAAGSCFFNSTALTPGPCPGLPTITDPRNGRAYNTLQIGTQCWLKENLDIGNMIPGIQSSIPLNNAIEKYCYDDLATNCTTNGGLYTYNEMMGYQNRFILESFESAAGTTPPEGWMLELVTGTQPGITFVTSSINPTIGTAYAGNRFVNYNSYNISMGSTRLKKISAFSTINYADIRVEFAWYEDDGNPTSGDRVEVQWSTNGTTWNTAGSFPRCGIHPGWKEKSLVLPAGANNKPSLYIGFLFISGLGNNCSMDLVKVTGTGNICPDGWHVPSEADLTTLAEYAGGNALAGAGLKEAGVSHWSIPNTGAANIWGFNALPGGIRDTDGAFIALGEQGTFWSSTPVDASQAFVRHLFHDSMEMQPNTGSRTTGASVRCLKN